MKKIFLYEVGAALFNLGHKSLNSMLKVSIMVISVSTILFLLGVNSVVQSRVFEYYAEKENSEYMEACKDRIKNQVNLVLSSIEIEMEKAKNGTSSKEQAQKNVLALLAKLRTDNGGYLFAGSLDGVSLLGPDKGLNLLQISDPDGKKVIRGIVEKAKAGGGFINYTVPATDGQKPLRKMGYVVPVKDWGWYIGTGINLDDVNSVISTKKNELHREWILTNFILVGFALLVTIFTYLVMRFLYSRLIELMNKFAWFFKRAASEAVRIDVDQIYFDEFRTIAMHANEMVEGRIEQEKKIGRLAFFDNVTGLPNRVHCSSTIHEITHDHHGGELHGAFLYIDIDNFKFINDTFGHSFGDEVLKAVAQRLSQIDSVSKYLARISGDEFILVLLTVTRDQVRQWANAIIDMFEHPFTINENQIYITVSIGVAMYPEHGTNSEALLQKADVAMHDAKAQGKNRFTIFDPNTEKNIIKNTRMSIGLKNAMRDNEFVVYYQPQVDVHTGQVKGLEALIRWQSKEFGLVPPSEFIPVSEETGQIVQIGEWVLRNACSFAKELNRSRTEPIVISVNVSAKQLLLSDFAEKLKHILEEVDVKPELIGIELTESSLVESFNLTCETLKKISSLGVVVHLDDFGTGYSSLNYLRRLYFDTIKIDSSFIWDAEQDPAVANIVHTIISLASILGMRTVAEGIENQVQLEMVRTWGVDLAQGYLYTKPVDAEHILEWLRKEEKQ